VLAANASDLWLRTFLALGFTFGFRKSEMLSLRVRNVDLLDGSLTLDTSKNGEGRLVKLTAETKKLLAECMRRKQADDFVLTHEDGGRAPNLWVGIDRFFFFLHNLNACRTFRNGGNPCRLPSNGSSKEESPYTSDCRPSETSAPERSR